MNPENDIIETAINTDINDLLQILNKLTELKEQLKG